MDDEDLLGEVKEKQSLHRQQEEDEEEEEGERDPNALLGSHRGLFGGSCELLADQFQLHSLVSKRQQMMLLEVDCTVKQVIVDESLSFSLI